MVDLVARGRARVLWVVAGLLVLLGLSWAAMTGDALERVAGGGLTLAGLVGLGLVWRERERGCCWVVIGALIGAALARSGVRGLAAQGPELMLLALVPMLAGLLIDRRALWIATASAGAALLLGAAVDLGVASDTPLRAALALLGLLAIALALDLVSVRLEQALATSRRKYAELEQALDRLAENQQERANLERAVAQAQRLESLGRLAGGVAHDFNNLLGGIRGNIELATMLDDRDKSIELLQTANSLVDRAAILTRNLLRFAKGQPLDAVLVDINELLRGSEPIYHSLVGKQIELHIELDATRSTIAFNPAQFEQLLLNLIVNASDAMPNGGRLRIGTRDLADDQLELFVSDTGQGMSESIQVMIFQPFFTTKGTGTGIGLATVHDIVEAAGGEIHVDSTVGRGTRFCVRLPIRE